jgi:hypothetical protein
MNKVYRLFVVCLLFWVSACGEYYRVNVTNDPVALVARSISEAYFQRSQPWASVYENSDYYVDAACGLNAAGCFLFESSLIRAGLDDITKCQVIAHEYGHAQCAAIYGNTVYDGQCGSHEPYFTTVLFEECDRLLTPRLE